MTTKTIQYKHDDVPLYFGGQRNDLFQLLETGRQIVFLTDEHLWERQKDYLAGQKMILVPPGEEIKHLQTVEHVLQDLIDLQIDRGAILVGFGGGVVTDLAGFVAAIYKRGISCALVPTSILAMVDAAIGGKNGVDFGDFKNMVGTIRQPEFIFYDYGILESLPEVEWVNGFAEIIKHACTLDSELFLELEKGSFSKIRSNKNLTAQIIKKNALLKAEVVTGDEQESGARRKLNFGHTLGHAIENQLGLRHGFAVAIGILFSCFVSQKETGFKETDRVVHLLKKYGLPIQADFEKEKAMSFIRLDKKRTGNNIHFPLLTNIGQSIVKPLPLDLIKSYLDEWK